MIDAYRMDLNFRGTKLSRIENFCVFRVFIFCTNMCFAYKPTKHVWAARRVEQLQPSNDGVQRYSALRTCPSSYNPSYSAHSKFFCKVCVKPTAVNRRSQLRRRAKVVVSKIAQRMFEVASRNQSPQRRFDATSHGDTDVHCALNHDSHFGEL